MIPEKGEILNLVAAVILLRMTEREQADAQFDEWLAFMADRVAIDYFHHHVVGVTRRNDDGTDRQEILKGCKPRDMLWLVPQPDNPYDKNAIRVMTGDGKQIGFLDRRLAQETTNRIAAGETFWVFVRSVHRLEHSESLGIVIVVMSIKPAVVAEVSKSAKLGIT